MGKVYNCGMPNCHADCNDCTVWCDNCGLKTSECICCPHIKGRKCVYHSCSECINDIENSDIEIKE